MSISDGVQNRGPGGGGSLFGSNTEEEKEYPSENVLYRYDSATNLANTATHTNVLTTEYFDYIKNIQVALPDAINAVSYGREVEMNVLAKGEKDIVKFETSANADNSNEGFGSAPIYWGELPEDNDFILSLYDLIGEGSRYPTAKNEIAIVVDKYNRIDKEFFEKLGIFSNQADYELSDFIGKSFLSIVPNNNFYTKSENGLFAPATAESYAQLYDSSDVIQLEITGALRLKEGLTSASGYLSEGLVYTTALTDYIVEDAATSEIALAQKNSDRDVILNSPFANKEVKQLRMRNLGADTSPSIISIYPKDFTGKAEIKQYLDDYNSEKGETDQVVYSDLSDMIGSTIQTLLNSVSYVLIGFAAISLIVSTIMIGIITYISVLERTKEIGILRSIGARKKDVSRVFNAETLIVGFVAGSLGIIISYSLVFVMNIIISNLINIDGLAKLTGTHSTVLILGSMLLTLIAGLIPARMATKKDPVLALRSE
ncbi:ABC transporter permease [Paenibacillus sp. JCM 10914]|uniref:ABC transporter permease n=1 Tax=Paenibacillus sp. JCM 10914 TaxID=1236974 RepID=UPI0003CC568E|nr:ABC transporter permease [Paenibacillus sp. JCM 10914]GAE08722.1 ABC transporter ATP binding protein [Paenibacillus sp. JCM 10914]